MWDQMFRATLPYGRKGLAIHAISAVDLALWDLLGKVGYHFISFAFFLFSLSPYSSATSLFTCCSAERLKIVSLCTPLP
jgi:hypothetical protein